MASPSHSPDSSSPDVEESTPDARRQQALRERGEIPEHVACIMDGNGRWAQRREKARHVGHHEGVTSVRDITESCAQLGVDYLTLYTFSTENWNRPKLEVKALMQLLMKTVRDERKTLMENGVRLNTIGDLSELPAVCRHAIRKTKASTADNDRMVLTLALSYSGRSEILRAVRGIAEDVKAGRLEPEHVDEALFVRYLDTAGMPDPDLLIRTGGEYRLSNFLLWQSAYTELFITDRYWPDFRREQLYDAVRSYQDRDRRFGRVDTEGYDADPTGDASDRDAVLGTS